MNEWIYALIGAVPAFCIGLFQGIRATHDWYGHKFGDVLQPHAHRVTRK